MGTKYKVAAEYAPEVGRLFLQALNVGRGNAQEAGQLFSERFLLKITMSMRVMPALVTIEYQMFSSAGVSNVCLS